MVDYDLYCNSPNIEKNWHTDEDKEAYDDYVGK